MTDYLYQNDDESALTRLRQLEEIEDPGTVEELTRIGVDSGWKCLEIGAGAGSIAYWLSERVGKSGVVATDVSPVLLDSSRCEIWCHDISKDDLPENMFDLIHVRHTLIHISKSRHSDVLNKIVRSLKIGGYVVAEESDLTSWQPDEDVGKDLQGAFTGGVQSVLSAYSERDMDIRLGEHLETLIERAGCRLANTSRRQRRVSGGTNEARYQKQTLGQLARSIRETNRAGAEAINFFLDCFEDTGFSYHSRTTVTVSAIRP